MANMKQLSSAVVLLAAFALPAAASTGYTSDKMAAAGKSGHSSSAANNGTSGRDVDFGVGLGEFSIGLGLLSSKLDSDFREVSTAGGATGFTEHYSASDTTLTGEASVGYTWNWTDRIDTGLEFYYDFGHIETEQTATNLGYNTHTVNSVLGLRALPGFYVTPMTKVFLDLGWAYIDQEISVKRAGNASDYSKTSKSNHTSAYRYGAGVQMDLAKNFSLRAGYAVIDGGDKIKITSTDGTESMSAKPTIHNFAVNALYNFAI